MLQKCSVRFECWQFCRWLTPRCRDESQCWKSELNACRSIALHCIAHPPSHSMYTLCAHTNKHQSKKLQMRDLKWQERRQVELSQRYENRKSSFGYRICIECSTIQCTSRIQMPIQPYGNTRFTREWWSDCRVKERQRDFVDREYTDKRRKNIL